MSADVSEAPSFVGRGRLTRIGERLIIPLAEEQSRSLPSRGQVAVDATLNGHPFAMVVEPDGRRGHWLPIDADMAASIGAEEGSEVEIGLRIAASWPEPDVPADLAVALEAVPEAVDVWRDITPTARWEWVRWIGATRNAVTRARRVDVTINKMLHGKRRPCCFDLSSCTDPELARSGKLIQPSA